MAVALLQVRFSQDYKTAEVQTTADAPGGARTERVGLPYDPDLFHHMVQHGVNIAVSSTSHNAFHRFPSLPLRTHTSTYLVLSILLYWHAPHGLPFWTAAYLYLAGCRVL